MMNRKNGPMPRRAEPERQVIAVTDPSPYPPVEVDQKNTHLLVPLSLDLASASGELTAIYQYIYQSILLQESYPVIADTLRRIAIVEMHHMNILGQIMVKLGGSPRAISQFGGRATPWNGTMPSYTNEIKQMLQVDLKSEQDTYHRYLLQAHRISDPNISSILRRIALDEEIHIKIFERFLTEL